MNRREMEELVFALNRRLHTIERVLNVSEIWEPDETSLFGGTKKTKSLTMIGIEKQIKLLSETLGYEFKPESTKKEPAKFVKKVTKKEKKWLN